MPNVRFEGELARELWGRIKDQLGLIEAAATDSNLSGDEFRDAEVRMVTFLVSAAFGYRSRLDRFKYLSTLNRDIYRILYANEEITADIDTGSHMHRISL